MILVAFLPLFFVSGLVLSRIAPITNPGILIFLFVFGLIFVGGVLSIIWGWRKRKAAKFAALSQN